MTENQLNRFACVLIGIVIGVALFAMIIAFIGCEKKYDVTQNGRYMYSAGFISGFGEGVEMCRQDILRGEPLSTDVRNIYILQRLNEKYSEAISILNREE